MQTANVSAWLFGPKPLFTAVTLTKHIANTAHTGNTRHTMGRWCWPFIAVSLPYLTETVQHATH